MCRFLMAVGTALLAGALLMNGTPAQAGNLEWTDAPGDATGIGVDEVESTPRPSDNQLDILKTNWSSDGKYLTLVMQVASIAGEPTGSTGRDYRFYFTHKDTRWAVGAQLPSAPMDSAFIKGPIMYNDTDGEYGECGGCKANLDEKKNTFTLRVAYDTFDRAFPGSEKVGPGTKFTELTSVAARFQVALIMPADNSDAPKGTTFTF